MLQKIIWVSMVLLGALQFTRAATMYLYNNSVSVFYEATPEKASTLLDQPCYNPLLGNIFIVHGLRGSPNGSIMQCFLRAATDVQSLNVFLWNWSKEATVSTDYPVPENWLVALGYVGKVPSYVWTAIQMGQALLSMESTGRFDLGVTTIVGHSLGAHVAGICGDHIKSKGKIVNRISGCDPSYQYHIFPTLSKDSATFVDTIRSDRLMSKDISIGKVDFWVNWWCFPTGVNKEEVQPGCPPRDDEILSKNSLCSHNRCMELWVRSFFTTLEAYKIKDGAVIATSDVGYKVDINATGDYYINTTDFAECVSY